MVRNTAMFVAIYHNISTSSIILLVFLFERCNGAHEHWMNRAHLRGHFQMWYPEFDHDICPADLTNAGYTTNKIEASYGHDIIYSIIWSYMILYDIIWYYMIVYDIIWYYRILYCMILYDIISSQISNPCHFRAISMSQFANFPVLDLGIFGAGPCCLRCSMEMPYGCRIHMVGIPRLLRKPPKNLAKNGMGQHTPSIASRKSSDPTTTCKKTWLFTEFLMHWALGYTGIIVPFFGSQRRRWCLFSNFKRFGSWHVFSRHRSGKTMCRVLQIQRFRRMGQNL